MDKFHVVAEQGVAHVRVWSHSAWCLRGWKVHRLDEVKQEEGLRQVGRTLKVLFHRLEVTLTVLNDVGDVLRFRLRVRQLRRSLVVQVIQEFHLTGVQGLYQLKLYHLV